MIRVVLLLNLVAVAILIHIRPRDLIEEAESQLEQLRALVELDTLVAFYDLQELAAEFYTYSNNLYESGSIDLQQEQGSIDLQLSTIKDLAQSSGKDITFCINNHEGVLNDLCSHHRNEMEQCISNIKSEALVVTNSSRYIIDTTITQVHNLENQFRLCKEDLLCISPLIDEVRRYKAILPQNIKEQMQTTKEMLNSLEFSVEGCTSQTMAQYVSEANSILSDIVECANKIIEI